MTCNRSFYSLKNTFNFDWIMNDGNKWTEFRWAEIDWDEHFSFSSSMLLRCIRDTGWSLTSALYRFFRRVKCIYMCQYKYPIKSIHCCKHRVRSNKKELGMVIFRRCSSFFRAKAGFFSNWTVCFKSLRFEVGHPVRKSLILCKNHSPCTKIIHSVEKSLTLHKNHSPCIRSIKKISSRRNLATTSSHCHWVYIATLPFIVNVLSLLLHIWATT